jgi:hypothetical protein
MSGKFGRLLTVGVLGLAAIATVVGLVIYINVPPPPPISHTLSINLSAPGTINQLQIGTNIQSSADVISTNTARTDAAMQALTGLNQPMLRLHLGFRSGGTSDAITLPEMTKGDWNFTLLDATITQLRAHHINFFFDVRTAPPWMFDNTTGQLPDSAFPEFATYMARLVGWYNQGGITDDHGVFHKSGHYGWVKTWEIWNEPKSGWDIPANVPNRAAAPWMTSVRYANLYDMTVAAMKAVDPTILVGGPAINSYPDIPYLAGFIENETAPLDFFSLHYYGGINYQEPDAKIFTDLTGARLVGRLVALRQLLQKYHPGENIPFWVDELNVDEASTLPIDVRGTDAFAYPFLADTFVRAEQNGVTLLDQFSLFSDAQFGMLDINSYQIYRPYWLLKLFSQEFPPGATLLPVTMDSRLGVVAMAAIAPDGKSLHVLLGNVQTATTTDVDGKGVVEPITLNLSGTYQGLSTSQNATLWTFDHDTPATGMPAPQSLTLTATSTGGMTLPETLSGYGVQILTIPLG